jgi:hypothetical protein
MIRKIAHSILRAPAETESPTATNVPPDSRGPNSRAWMSKIGRLEPTEEPPAKKEDDDASTKTADGGSDPDRPANAPGVDADPNPGTDASNAAAAANAIAAKKKAVPKRRPKPTPKLLQPKRPSPMPPLPVKGKNPTTSKKKPSLAPRMIGANTKGSIRPG